MAEEQLKADQRLFFLFNDGENVCGYSASFPGLASNGTFLTTLNFKGPYDLGTQSEFGQLVSCIAAEPVYDSQGLQVFYATNTRHNDKEGKSISMPHNENRSSMDERPGSRSAISVWTIGRYVSRDRVEHTALRGASWEARPSVLFENKIVSTGVLEYFSGDESVYRIGQKPENLPYTEFSVLHDDDKTWQQSGGQAKLFTSPLPGMEYVYNIVPFSPKSASWFNIHTIRLSNFKNLNEDRNLSWQTTKFFPSFRKPILPAHAFSEDIVTMAPKLLLFSWGKSYNSILTACIELRENGSIQRTTGTGIEVMTTDIDLSEGEPGNEGDSDQDEYPAPPKTSRPSGNLNAFVLGRELLLVWSTGDKFGSIMGRLNDDGTIPKDWQWYTVTVTFDHDFKKDVADYTFNGVIVGKDFVP